VGAAHWYACGPVVGQFCDAQSLFASQALPSAQRPAHDGAWQYPLSQLPDWQSPSWAHACPSLQSGVQAGGAH
jgi:hypothetical protein